MKIDAEQKFVEVFFYFKIDLDQSGVKVKILRDEKATFPIKN